MKIHLLIIFTFLFLSNCSGQPTFESNFLDNEEVRGFIKKHPTLSYEDIVKSDYPEVMTNAGISFVGISGLLIGYELDDSEFQKNFMDIKNTYTYLLSLETFDLEPHKSFCESDTIIPDVTTILKYSYFKLNQNSKIYLLKNENGIFVEKKYLTYPYDCPNPSHGYSCGAVVDSFSKKILYWVIFW